MNEPADENQPGNEWDEVAQGWDGDEATRAYAGAAFASLLVALESRGVPLAGATAIDFGCGTGLLTEQLVSAGARVHAIDTSHAMLAVLEQKIATHRWLDVTTGAAIPPTAGGVDVVVCSSVCGFLDDYPGTVVEIVGRMSPGGLFVQWDWERTGGESHGLSREEIVGALDRAGLQGVAVDIGFEIEAHGHTMAPLMGSGWRPPLAR